MVDWAPFIQMLCFCFSVSLSHTHTYKHLEAKWANSSLIQSCFICQHACSWGFSSSLYYNNDNTQHSLCAHAYTNNIPCRHRPLTKSEFTKAFLFGSIIHLIYSISGWSTRQWTYIKTFKEIKSDQLRSVTGQRLVQQIMKVTRARGHNSVSLWL